MLDKLKELNFNQEQSDFFLEQIGIVRNEVTKQIAEKAIQLIYLHENKNIYMAVIELENLIESTEVLQPEKQYDRATINKIIEDVFITDYENIQL